MTDQTTAPPSDAWIEWIRVRAEKDSLRFGRTVDIPVRADLLLGLLSKLRAPVAVPQGYALVPIVPTPEMLDAADERVGAWQHEESRAAYSAMVGAAPVASAPVADERAAFDAWFLAQPINQSHHTDTTQIDAAFMPYQAWQARAALASAPVVQRQHHYQIRGGHLERGSDMHMWVLMAPWNLQMLAGNDLRHVTDFGKTAYAAGKADAAPQASEAVRDLLIRAQAWMATTRGANRPNNLIRLIDDALSAQPPRTDRLPQRVMAQVVLHWMKENPDRVPTEDELVEAFELRWM